MRTSLKKALVLFAATALSIGGAFAEDDPILLGIPLGLSGANSVTAPAVIQAMDLAISEINDAGGVLNRKFAMELADSASSAAGAQKAYD
ncbi:ABC transporter substrate-binding protein, partial [Mesorhizobium sp. Root552]|uniref:ABC transporter substrate-binding protein n=1 Tax=Mesorhizobium sp. Root552 TaxID=1736555 RepID=UPI000A868331